jgi:osmotically-inducible protein OsmY
VALALAAGLGLAACDHEDQSALRSRAKRLVDDTRAAAREMARKVEHDTTVVAAQAKQSLGRYGDTARQIAGDVAIATRVKAAVVAEKNIKTTEIRVEAFQGRVILRGTVPDDEQLALAAQVAREVDGVKSVDNRLTVN